MKLIKRFQKGDSVEYGTKEYKEAYNKGKLARKVGETYVLPPLEEVTVKPKDYNPVGQAVSKKLNNVGNSITKTAISFTPYSPILAGMELGASFVPGSSNYGDTKGAAINAGLEILPLGLSKAIPKIGKGVAILSNKYSNDINYFIGKKFPTVMHRELSMPLVSDKIIEGSRQAVYDSGNYVKKVGKYGSSNKKDFRSIVKLNNKKSKVPGMKPESYQGFIKENGEMKPVYLQRKVAGAKPPLKDFDKLNAETEKIMPKIKDWFENHGWIRATDDAGNELGWVNTKSGLEVSDIHSRNLVINPDGTPTFYDLDIAKVPRSSKDNIMESMNIVGDTPHSAQNKAMLDAATNYNNTMYTNGALSEPIANRAKNLGLNTKVSRSRARITLVDENSSLYDFGDSLKEGRRNKLLIRHNTNGIAGNTSGRQGNIAIFRRDPKGTMYSPSEIAETTSHESLHRMQAKTGWTLDKPSNGYYVADESNAVAAKLKPYLAPDKWAQSADEVWADLHAFRMSNNIGARDLTDSESMEAVMQLARHWDMSKFNPQTINTLKKALQALPTSAGVYLGTKLIPKNENKIH